MKTLICGSMAYDHIMVFDGHFKDHILPDQVHILNVAFLVPKMRREFGGCAGNIAYNLKLLGGEPMIMATLGTDSAPYRERLTALGLSQTYIKDVADSYTAQAFITNDLSDNQITAFHPGAMSFAHVNQALDAKQCELAIVSPDGKEAMMQHAAQLAQAKIPFAFDPGQALPMFSGDELRALIGLATYVIVNDYEGHLLSEKTGLSAPDIAAQVTAYIVTRGAQGSTIYAADNTIAIDAVKVETPVDPTGCGDAYRAGILFGLANGFDWKTTGQLASVMGALKIAQHGGQNHTPTLEAIAQLFEASYGVTFDARILDHRVLS